MFPAPAVILSCVAIVVSVALSVADCASEPVVSTSENVIPVTKTNNTRNLDFVIHFIKEAVLYIKLPLLSSHKKDRSAALTTTILKFKSSQLALPFLAFTSKHVEWTIILQQQESPECLSVFVNIILSSTTTNL
jgi:hypothetical protein